MSLHHTQWRGNTLLVREGDGERRKEAAAHEQIGWMGFQVLWRSQAKNVSGSSGQVLDLRREGQQFLLQPRSVILLALPAVPFRTPCFSLPFSATSSLLSPKTKNRHNEKLGQSSGSQAVFLRAPAFFSGWQEAVSPCGKPSPCVFFMSAGLCNAKQHLHVSFWGSRFFS